MDHRRQSLRSSARLSASLPEKRSLSEELVHSSGKSHATKRHKNKQIQQELLRSSQPSGDDVVELPNYEFLAKASELSSYHRALLLKRDEELLNLDLSLSQPFSKTKDESSKVRLEKVLRWKLLRGQYRAALPGLVAQNASQDVDKVVHKAIDQLSSCQTVDKALQSEALSTMCQLKGVGPATAAAFLSFEFPSLIPIFSDEAASFMEKELGPIKYTLPFYKKFANLIQLKTQQISRPDDNWDVNRLERALWTFKLLKKHLADQDWIALMGPKR